MPAFASNVAAECRIAYRHMTGPAIRTAAIEVNRVEMIHRIIVQPFYFTFRAGACRSKHAIYNLVEKAMERSICEFAAKASACEDPKSGL